MGVVLIRPEDREADALGEQDEEPAQAVLDLGTAFRAHGERLLRTAHLVAGSEADAQDAVAEVFARLYRRPPSPDIGNVGAYLRRCVVNEVIGRARASDRRRMLFLRRPAMTASPEDAVAERDRLWRALQRLPTRQRAVLVLRFFDDLAEIDIADVLGVPAGTVKSTAARALAKLREELEGEDDE